MKPTLDELLCPIGMTNRYRGYPYFVMAVNLVLEDPSRLSSVQKELYLPIAHRYHVNMTSVERALRTVRDVVVRNGGPDYINYLNGNPAYRGCVLYPAELIELFARFLRRPEKPGTGYFRQNK